MCWKFYCYIIHRNLKNELLGICELTIEVKEEVDSWIDSRLLNGRSNWPMSQQGGRLGLEEQESQLYRIDDPVWG